MSSAIYYSFILFSGLVAAQQKCDTYTVPNLAGGFRSRQFIDFSTAKAGQDAQQLLSNNGLVISDWDVSDGPITHTFTPKNVALVDGAVALKVSAYPGSGKSIGAEFVTTAEFKYASVRTVQKSSNVPGVCEGNFFFKNDYAEIDFEILTSSISNDTECVPAGIWATTQPLAPGETKKSEIYPFTFDPRADFHEYRIDWTPGLTQFYIDGKKMGNITENIPTVSGPWMWNAWSNGDPCWSAGPPTKESTTLIRSIEIIKDYSTTVTGNVCP